MSSGLPIFKASEDDISKLLVASVHLGAKNTNFQMDSYVYKRKQDGTHIINLHKTYEKMLLAARIIVAIENPKDVAVISARPYGTRAVLKFAAHVGATAIAGRFCPGTFTNQIQKAFIEPRLLVVTDPRTDHQAVREASYVNTPTIALANTDSPLRYIDVAIPCNNKGIHSIGIMWWMLAREVLRLRGSITRTEVWEYMPDLYFFRDTEEVEKADQAALPAAGDAPEAQAWAETAAPAAADWATTPAQAFPAAGTTEDWGASAAGDWGAATASGWEQPAI